jgi:oligopeptide transport system ATP-binding protein
MPWTPKRSDGIEIMKLLEIKNLRTEFKTQGGIVQAVRGVNFHIDKGEFVGVVGESGSGKSVTMLSVMGLLAENGRVTEGEIIFDGRDISPLQFSQNGGPKAYEQMMQKIRAKEIGMVFQDPMTFLNPVLRVDTQLTESLMLHEHLNRRQARERALELMDLVGIPSPKDRLKQYPFEFSGGMRQRIIIAIALSCNPKLIIADEPTTALDLTIQAQILDLMVDLKKKLDSSILLITHDLGVVASSCSRVIIMYGGKVVEQGTAYEIFHETKHPYTLGLLNSINNPELDEAKPLIPIPGSTPDLLKPPEGCPFVDRCEKAMWVCKKYLPQEKTFSETHKCSCWLHYDRSVEND